MTERQPVDENEFAKRLERAEDAARNDEDLPHLSVAQNPVEKDQFDAAARVVGLIHRVRKTKEASQHDTAADKLDTHPQHANAGADSIERTAPNKIGRFLVQRQIGQGGYGLVFLAYDPQLGREVAIKVPRPEAIMTSDLASRFMREAKAAASLSHPNIVPVFEAGSAGPVCFIASQFIHGISLAQWLGERSKPVDGRDAALLVANLAHATQHAHNRGVLHRDLKPSNVLLEINPDATIEKISVGELAASSKITDFGLAKLADDPSETRSGAILGTPAYMSPEQTRGQREEVGPGADVYSLGVILYELITGQVPFAADSIIDTINAVQQQEPPRPSKLNPLVTRDLEAVTLKCLEKQPRARYATASDLAEDLERYLGGQTVEARSVSNVQRMMKWGARNPVPTMLLSALVLAIVIGVSAVSVVSIRSDYLGRIADVRRKQVADKSRQLTQAINQLTAIAESPELKTSGAEELRKRLLGDSNRYYEEFFSETPDDPTVRLEFLRSLYRLAQIKTELGDLKGGIELAQQALDELGSVPLDQGSRLAETKLRLECRSLVGFNGGKLGNVSKMTGIATRSIELARAFAQDHDDELEANILLAETLSDSADLVVQTGNRTLSRELALEALAIWIQIDPALLKREEKENAAYSFAQAAKRNMSAEMDKEQGIAFGLEAVQRLEYLINESDPAPSRLLDWLAEVNRVLGFLYDKDFERARVVFDRSTELFMQLAARHPLVPKYQQRLLTVGYSYALSHFLSGHLSEAKQRLVDNIEAAGPIIDRFPDEEQSTLRPKANSLVLLGIVYGQEGRLDEQLETLEQSLALNLRLYQLRGGSSNSAVAVAGNVGSIAHCLTKMGRHEEALTKYEQSNGRLMEILKNDPNHGEAQRYWSTALMRSSDSLVALGRLDDALQAYQLGTEKNNVATDKSVFAGGEAIILAHMQRYEDAVQRFEVFTEFQMNLTDQTRLDASMQLILTTANDLLQITSDQMDADSGNHPAGAVALRDNAIDAAIVALNSLSQYWVDEPNKLTEYLDDNSLVALEATDQFQTWHANR